MSWEEYHANKTLSEAEVKRRDRQLAREQGLEVLEFSPTNASDAKMALIQKITDKIQTDILTEEQYQQLFQEWVDEYVHTHEQQGEVPSLPSTIVSRERDDTIGNRRIVVRFEASGTCAIKVKVRETMSPVQFLRRQIDQYLRTTADKAVERRKQIEIWTNACAQSLLHETTALPTHIVPVHATIPIDDRLGGMSR